MLKAKGKMSKNRRYRDKKWLSDKYLKEKLSLQQIAKLCNVDHKTIYYWLKKFNIPRRSISEAMHLIQCNHCNLSREAIEWLNGEMLGDGCIFSRHSYSALFNYGSKYHEYIRYISNTLNSFGIKQMGKTLKRSHIVFGKYNIYYSYASLNYRELMHLYQKWYSKGKNKTIPRDIKLTPLTCRQWYIGDGSIEHQKRSRPFIRLYTTGFPVSDVNFLVKQLIRLGFKAMRQKANNIIYISAYSTKGFLKYIGECPVKCYQYKFDY